MCLYVMICRREIEKMIHFKAKVSVCFYLIIVSVFGLHLSNIINFCIVWFCSCFSVCVYLACSCFPVFAWTILLLYCLIHLCWLQFIQYRVKPLTGKNVAKISIFCQVRRKTLTCNLIAADQLVRMVTFSQLLLQNGCDALRSSIYKTVRVLCVCVCSACPEHSVDFSI